MKHTSTLETNWPFAAASILFVILVASGVVPAALSNGGHWVYPVDDVYGHMAVAKNLALHGVWGFTPYGFTSGASSLLWPTLLALSYLIFGVNEYAPLVINMLIAVGILFCASRILRQYTRSPILNFAILSGIVLLVPLPAVCISGMEAPLQMLLDLPFVYLACRALTGEPAAPRERWALLILAALVPAARYEGLFLIAIAALLFLCRARIRDAISLGAAAAVPIGAFGLYSLSRGWYFLPNSVVLKGNSPDVSSLSGFLDYATSGYNQIVKNPHILMLVLAALGALFLVLRRRRTFWNVPALLLTIFLAVTCLHMQLAKTGWFFRYEAYLVLLGLLALVTAFLQNAPADFWTRRHATGEYAVLGLTVLLFGAPLGDRAGFALGMVVPVTANIYQQQYQMGLFLKEYYPTATVAANDIGAIDYMTNIHLVDLYGLGTMEVARAKLNGTYSTGTIHDVTTAQGVRIAVVFDSWFEDYGGLPDNWIRVGQWTIPDNKICGDDTVSWYAVGTDAAAELHRNLCRFADRLPKEVMQKGAYCNGEHTSVITAYDREADGDTFYWWTSRDAQLLVYSPPGGKAGSLSLILPILTQSKELQLEVYINDQLLTKDAIPSAKESVWNRLVLRANWKAGLNVVRVVGHGEPVTPEGDDRKLLFSVREPQWQGL